MKHLLNLFLLLVLSNGILAQSNQLWLVDPLEPIYPDKNNLSAYSAKWSADYPENIETDVHVVVRVPKGAQFTLNATLDGKLLRNCWSKLIHVPVEQNTGLDSRTEQYKGNINPYVIRRAPFRIYEVIEPMDSEAISSEEYAAFRLTVPPEEFSSLGKHKISIEVKGADWELSGVFMPKIHDVKVPDLKDGHFFYTNWFKLTNMEDKHHVERWTAGWFDMLRKYANLLANGRQNSITIPGELITYNNGKFELDEDRMLRFIDVFRAVGFTHFESPHLMNRGDNDDWGDPELKVALTKRRYYTENGKDDVEQLITLIRDFAVKNNLANNWMQHISDEPTATQAACYVDIAKQLKSIFPEIKIMEATNDREGLVGAVDYWCPLINDFQENEAFFRGREKHGEKVLVYTCLIPGGPWLNRTLDMERIRQVYFGWGAAHYNTYGFLHWGLNYYAADPFMQSVVHHPAPGAGANNFLPAGDTHIIYPGTNGPLSSIRFEAHRIGIEDYELLYQLKQTNPKLVEKQIGKIFRSYTDYDTSLSSYRKVKKKVLKAL